MSDTVSDFIPIRIGNCFSYTAYLYHDVFESWINVHGLILIFLSISNTYDFFIPTDQLSNEIYNTYLLYKPLHRQVDTVLSFVNEIS